MMNMLKMGSATCIALGVLLTVCSVDTLTAQTTKAKMKTPKVAGPSDIPPLKFTEISGAPKLGHPQLIMGKTIPVMGEGMGWASPAFFDVNQDGKKDLLIGEFGSKLEDRGMPVGNFVRVYKNIGTSEQPLFDDHFYYLSSAEKKTFGNGTPLSIYTWCCLGFTPRLVDLDNDGIEDLVTGQYDPGFVTWFKGTKDGFLEGQKLPQYGDLMLGKRPFNPAKPWTDPDNWAYWVYSAVDFGDLDDDGFQDMIIGGSSLRMSKNIGKEDGPAFGRRDLLLDMHGKPLIVPADRLDTAASGYWKSPNYGLSMIPYVVDWNNDGTLDLLVTNGYAYSGSPVVTYFQGQKTDEGLRFHPGVSLFESLDGLKSFPGGYMHLYVTDWNNDGIQDLLLGTSVPFRKGKFDAELAYSWEGETYSSGTNPAYYSQAQREEIAGYLAKAENEKQREDMIIKFYGNEAFKDLYHQGYVYVLLGSTGNE